MAITVDPADSTCGTTSNPTCYTTITAAIKAATTSGTIEVYPGTYHERIALRSDIALSLKGKETARTILTGDGTGTIITANGVTTEISIYGFTFTSALVGIDVLNDSALKITNNVFTTGTGGIGVRVQNSIASLVKIENNTFYNNLTGVSSSTVMAIQYNIFANNTTAITSPASTTIRYNCFSENGNGGVFGDTTNNVLSPPLFVSPAVLDFHLQETSPCINAGDPSGDTDVIDDSIMDLGAYGGLKSDTIPYPVDFSPTLPALLTGETITLAWTANLSSVVTSTDPARQGGYNVYYRLNTAGTTTKVNLPGNTTNTVISGLTTSIAPPVAPTLAPPGFDNNTLSLSWSPVSGATGYIVYHVLASGGTTTSSPVIQKTSYDITGLTNLTEYTVWVTAITQPAYYFSVTTYDHIGPYVPGNSHESEYSPESEVLIGSVVESSPSTTYNEFPEEIHYYPDLPNKGCFIATAAYGHYDAPHVQALRDFRDRYLETNSAGRVFVSWYYEYGPIGAAALNEHPWLKPVVRTALLPAVGGALFLTKTSIVTQLMVLFLFSLLIAALVIYKKNAGRGGSR